MSFLSEIAAFLGTETAANLALALLHSLWQGIILALLLAVILRNMAGKHAELRYKLSLTALLAVVACWLISFAILQYTPAEQATVSGDNITTRVQQEKSTQTLPQPIQAIASESHEPKPQARTADSNSSDGPATSGLVYAGPKPRQLWYVSWLIPAWLAGMGLMLVRMFYALTGISKLWQDAIEVADHELLEMFGNLCQQMGIKRKIRLAFSKTLASPAVVGIWQPVLLLPISIMSQVSVTDLQMILAHELAHIRRYDYLVNFCQMVIESVLFFNPGVWLISRRIRIEREACCDLAGVGFSDRPVEYARVLFEQIARVSAPYLTPATAMAFSDQEPGVSQERITRIIAPEHKPGMKVGWVKLTCGLLIAAVVLLGLYQGTESAVSFAASIMTPQQRIEVMKEIEKTHGKPAFDPEGANFEYDVAIGGTIKTCDGEILGQLSHLAIYCTNESIHISPSAYSSDRSWFWDVNTGKFKHRCHSGSIILSVSSPGYATTFAGPFTLEPGQTKDDIEIILNKGELASVKIIDSVTKQPVVNAKVFGSYKYEVVKGSSFSASISDPVFTDTRGIAKFTNVVDLKATISVEASGYQKTEFKEQKFALNGTIILELSKARQARGVVISEKTGEPVANAVFRVVESSAPHQLYSKDYGNILATTDSEGRFVLDELTDGTKYIFCIKADGYAYALTNEVNAGQDNITVKLREPIVIPGEVVGPIEKLPTKDGKYYVPYGCVYSGVFDNSHNCQSGQMAFIKTDEQKITFEITDLWGTYVEIGTGIWRKTIKFNEPLTENLVLDLNDPLTAEGKPYQKRQLILEFETPTGFPLLGGNIRLSYMDPEFADNTYKGKLVDVIDGKAQAEIVVPGKICYRLADTVGYWFKEKSEIAVEAGTEPLVIKIPTIPAGMIYGEVFETDGKPVGNTLVSYTIVENSPLLDKDTHFLNVEGKNSAGSDELNTKYRISPLPLGGVYMIVAHTNGTYVTSKPIELSEEKPVQEINMVLPRGVDIPVSIAKPDGSPAAGIECELNFSIKSHGFSRTQVADVQGKLMLERVNPDAFGSYNLEIKGNKDYRPIILKLDRLDKPVQVTLEPGAVTTGIVIDSNTGWPIPGVEVTAWYSSESESEWQLEAESKTDELGQFRFSNMKSGRKYNLNFRNCREGGNITGGDTSGQTYKVTPYDGSKLKPKKP